MTLQTKSGAASKQNSIDEIDEIMNEIEELQQNMATAHTPATAVREIPAEAPSGMEDFQGANSDASMEETLGELKEDEATAPNLIDQVIAEEPEPVSHPDHEPDHGTDELLDETEAETLEALEDEMMTSKQSSSVSVKLSGEMTLRLSYEFEGQEVTIGFSDGALKVELSDGTEFKIPVRRTLKKVA